MKSIHVSHAEICSVLEANVTDPFRRSDIISALTNLSVSTAHPLQAAFNSAISQVETGKGRERHGGDLPFMEQPWRHYAKQHGIGFLTGQAVKKCDESQRLETIDAQERELLGAIVYAGMAVLALRELRAKQNARAAAAQQTQTGS